METSEQVKNIFSHLLAAMEQMPNPKKEATNPHFRSKYATLEGVLECKAVLLKHGIVTNQSAVEVSSGWALETRLTHCTSGEWISGLWPLVADKQTPQGMGSAQTYARRYALLGLLDMVAEDDDGQLASKPKAPVVHDGGAREHFGQAPWPGGTALDLPGDGMSYEEEQEKLKLISEPQRKRLLAIASKNGWTQDQIKEVIKRKNGIGSTRDIPWKIYDRVVEYFEKNKPEAR